MADFSLIQPAIFARIANAYARALTPMPTLELKLGFTNLKRWLPDSQTSYLRGYYKSNPETRLGGSDQQLYRTDIVIFLDVLVVLETGDDVLIAIGNAVKPAFFTGDDGLVFEQGSGRSNPREEGDHWLATLSYPTYWEEIRSA